jgi:hypothetical protein
VEGRLAGAFFPAPVWFISPGCPFGGPCNDTPPSRVEVVTLGGDVVALAGGRHNGPFVLAGGGAQYIRESPERRPAVRPYADLGAGMAMDVHGRVWKVAASFQLASSGADLPRWMIPITLRVPISGK